MTGLGLHRLNREEAAKLEVLNDWELLQALDMVKKVEIGGQERWKRERGEKLEKKGRKQKGFLLGKKEINIFLKLHTTITLKHCWFRWFTFTLEVLYCLSKHYIYITACKLVYLCTGKTTFMNVPFAEFPPYFQHQMQLLKSKSMTCSVKHLM